MHGQLGRRSVITLSAAGALSAAVTAFDSAPKRDRPAAPVAPPPPPPPPPPNTLMFIRHAEEPTGSTAPYGITEAGEVDDRSLNVRGWTRAGALVELFDPRRADGSSEPARAGISRPAMIFAPNPGSNDSRRSHETVTPLAAALNLEVDTRFAKGQAADLAAALTGLGGPVLVAWRREEIAAIIAGLGAVDPTPPASWPSDRFDVVYVLTRNGSGWTFSQIPQMLLAGDSPMPIT